MSSEAFSEDAGADNEVEVSFGDDLGGDEGQPAQAQPESDDFDPYSVNWNSIQEDQVPEQYRPLVGTARKIHGMVNQTNMDLRQREQELANEVARQREITAQLQQGGQAPAEQTAQQQVESVLSELGIQEGAQGYAEAQVVERIAAAVAQRQMAQTQDHSATIQNLQNEVTQLRQERVNAAESRAQNELDVATEKYGADVLNQYTDTILALRGKVNPATGQPHTVESVLALVTGQAARPAAQSAAQVENQITSGAAPVPTVGGGPQKQLNAGDLNAELTKLGFES